MELPTNKKYHVCFTIDFDAFSLWLGPDQVPSPTVLSRGGYGARVGIGRILDLLEKYDIRSTFFVPGHTVDTYPDIIENIHGRGHEIGHHGYRHERPNDLERDEEEEVIDKGIKSIEDVIGEKPVGYRSPGWDPSQNTIELLLKKDFVYDSSMMADDFTPYRCRVGDKIYKEKPIEFGKETDLLEIPVHWSLDDFPHFAYSEEPSKGSELSSPSKVFEIWSGDFDYMYDKLEKGVFTLTIHPQIIGRGHRINMVEKLIEHIKNYREVTFMKMKEVANLWKQNK